MTLNRALSRALIETWKILKGWNAFRDNTIQGQQGSVIIDKSQGGKSKQIKPDKGLPGRR